MDYFTQKLKYGKISERCVYRGIKRTIKPDSDAMSRSSKSSDDTVNVDAVLGSLLLLCATVMKSSDTAEGKSVVFIFARFLYTREETNTGLCSPGLERDSKLPPILSQSL